MKKEINREEFEAIVRPVIEYINNNFHPHVKIIIENDRAEIVEGLINYLTDDYIK